MIKTPASPLKFVAGGVMLCLVLLGVFWPAVAENKLIAPLDIAHKLLVPWKSESDGSRPQNHFTCDAVTQYLIYRNQVERSFREDGYIGWNPNEMGGVSLSSNTMALPASWTMQLHRVLSFAKAWNYGIVAEFFIAGLGMMVFLRSRNLEWLICLFGAVAYMLNSQFIIWVHHRWALSSFSWMPWVLWAGTGIEVQGSSRFRRVLFPVFLCLSILGATLQHLVFIMMAVGCMVLGYFQAFTKPDWKRISWWVAGSAVALMLSSFTILAQILAYLSNLSLGNQRGGIGYPEGHAQAILNLIVIPLQGWPWMLGDSSSMDGWRALKASYMDVSYLGTIPMLLAFVGVFRKEMPLQARLLAAAGLIVPLTPLVGPLYHRVQLVFLLGGAWLAAEMLQRLVRGEYPKLKKRWLVCTTLIGECLLVIAFLPDSLKAEFRTLVVKEATHAAANSLLSENPNWLVERCDLWIHRLGLFDVRTFTVYLLLLIGALALWPVASKLRKISVIGQSVLIIVTVLELAILARGWITFSPQEQFPITHPAIQKLQQLVGTDRVFQGKEQLGFLNSFATPNMLTSNGIRCVEGYESILHDGPYVVYHGMDPELRLRLSGAAWSAQDQSQAPIAGTEHWPIALVDSGVVIRKNPMAIPAAVAGAGPLPIAPLDVPSSLDHGSAVEVTRRTMNTISLVVSKAADWVRLDENADKGWRWRIDGGPWQPVFRGPDACAWLLLKGAHGKVELRYEPSSMIGNVLSCSGVIALIFFVAFPNIVEVLRMRKGGNIAVPA